jgi:hypothetical protein
MINTHNQVHKFSLVTETVRDKQNDELIKFAEPSSVPKEESSEDIEEAELDEAWDLDAEDNAPTECLQVWDL